MQRGFTLLELSIALTIIGLLAGGIMAGQSILQHAHLRRVGDEYERYSRATVAFHDQYLAYPGDMSNATEFWPSAVPGNGNGLIDEAGGASATGEVYEYWRQLAFAGLVEGSYSGRSGPAAAVDSRPDANVPISRFNGAGWSVHSMPAYFAGDASHAAGNYGTYFAFGAVAPGQTDGPMMTPADLFDIDSKYDDGKPMTGKVIATNWPQCSNAASAADTAADYKLTLIVKACGADFVQIF